MWGAFSQGIEVELFYLPLIVADDKDPRSGRPIFVNEIERLLFTESTDIFKYQTCEINGMFDGIWHETNFKEN